MRIACVYWKTSSVGGIATHLNTLRDGAIQAGDRFDILQSSNWKTKSPTLFPTRQWVRGGDTSIWVDGDLPQNEAGRKFLESNYDAVLYGFICPHRTKAYPEPEYRILYDVSLPKAAWVMDGYWSEYEDWGNWCLPRLRAVLCPQESYFAPVRKASLAIPLQDRPKMICSPFPFRPMFGTRREKDKTPLLVWPNQWKNIKGVNSFMDGVPTLPESVRVELYSNGIRYYQMRTEDRWRKAVGEDKFQGFNGDGRAVFYGNVDHPKIISAIQRAWFTANFQGGTAKHAPYRVGSYNNTEVESLYYGALPILHSSAQGTRIPSELYLKLDNPAEELRAAVELGIRGLALSPIRQEKARQFVMDTHYYRHRYADLRSIYA